jgi:hypothetical protein
MDDRGFESRQGLGIFLLTTVSRLTLGPTQPLGSRITFPTVNRPVREADHSPPPTAEVKNAWNYTSAPQYAFMAWCSVKAQGQLHLHKTNTQNGVYSTGIKKLEII